MSDKEKSDKKAAHWLKPLKGKWRPARHLLVWIEEEQEGATVRARGINLYSVLLTPDGKWRDDSAERAEWHNIEDALDDLTRESGTLTIWLPEGWEHLVMCGLAELIDRGAITWRYCQIDTHRLLIRGAWRGRSIVIASLANWTGGSWDQWRGKSPKRGQGLFLECWKACAQLCWMVRCGSMPATAGAAGLLVWRSWLGPRLEGTAPGGSKGSKTKTKKQAEYVGPVPSRPERCRHAERHCAYGLVHRQLRRGRVEGPIYCVDVSSCYLLCLMSMPVPIFYRRYLHRPSVDELAEEMTQGTGCALVQLRSPADPYPTRRGGRILWARGNYWTWLAGTELAMALWLGHVQSCEAAHLWSARQLDADTVGTLTMMETTLAQKGNGLLRAAWRSIYSQLVGRFAGWQRRWVDAPARHNFGRWAMWQQARPEDGHIITHRSIAGRCQRLQDREDSGDSVALLFACVTAQGRWILSSLANCAGRPNVLSVEADSLWVTPEGWQALQRRCSEVGVAPDSIRAKEVFDRAWLTGEAVSVVELEGKRYLRCPGVPADIVVGPQGTVQWPLTEDWFSRAADGPGVSVRRTHGSMNAARIVDLHDYEPEILDYGDELDDPAMSAELLEPLGGGGKAVWDE